MNTKIYLIASLISISTLLKAQVGSVGDFFGGGSENAALLFESYFAPWVNALGADLNAGWYNTAKSHKLGGFDISLVALSMSFVPEQDKTFDLNDLNLQDVTFPGGNESPTAAGDKSGAKEIFYNPIPSQPVGVSFESPNGTGVGFMPMPMVQVGIGTIKETDISFRYLPRLSIGDVGKAGLWGIGLKHGIKQWIPAISKIPVLQIALQGGYTKFSTNFDLNVEPADLGLTGTGVYDNQEFAMELTSFTANILVGAHFPIVDFYGGIGMASTKANIMLNGNYPIPSTTAPGAAVSVEDPVDIEVTNSDDVTVKPRMNIGMRVKLGVFTFHGDYTRANYNVVSVGMGFSFR